MVLPSIRGLSILKKLDAIWKKLMINQFHDIIPGSSINLVYQTTHKEYEEIHAVCDELFDKSSNLLFEQDSNCFVLVNTLSNSWEGKVVIPKSFNGFSVTNIDGGELPIQKSENEDMMSCKSRSFGITTFVRGDKVETKQAQNRHLVLENNRICYTFNQDGQMVSAYDKEFDKEVLTDPGNVLSLYEDRPNNWDAWDVDFFTETL